MNNVYRQFEESDPMAKELVDRMFESIVPMIRAEKGLKFLGDDRAERLVEAMAVYVKECSDAEGRARKADRPIDWDVANEAVRS